MAIQDGSINFTSICLSLPLDDSFLKLLAPLIPDRVEENKTNVTVTPPELLGGIGGLKLSVSDFYYQQDQGIINLYKSNFKRDTLRRIK